MVVGGEETKVKNGRKEKEKIAFYKLFAFADKLDITLIVIGSFSAIGNGISYPMMSLLLGHFINSFAAAPPSQVVHEVSKVCILFVYIAIGAGALSLLQMLCWMVTGERQAARIRALYLKTILKQDIEFFDTQTTSGDVVGRLSGDTIHIQEAMGEKVGKFIQFLSTFLGGLVIAFIQGWHLALMLCTCIPALALSGACMGYVMTKMAIKGHMAYSEAGNVVEQTIGAIRTVASYTGEKQATEKYDSKLKIAYSATVKQGLASGIGNGCLLLVVFATYGLAIWYGGKLILNHEYNGGIVINIAMTMMSGGMALGQTSPCLNSFAAGQAAAYKMFETIKRIPKIDVSNNKGAVLENMKGDIELRDVHFKYPSRPQVQIFSGFSLHVPFGQIFYLIRFLILITKLLKKKKKNENALDRQWHWRTWHFYTTPANTNGDRAHFKKKKKKSTLANHISGRGPEKKKKSRRGLGAINNFDQQNNKKKKKKI